jgi:parallel beta-helix repeat protein
MALSKLEDTEKKKSPIYHRVPSYKKARYSLHPHVGKSVMKVSQRVLNLLLTSLLELSLFSLGIHTVTSNNAITINPDGSINPTNAPLTRNGDIFTLTSSISEPIEIHRNNTVFDGENYSVQGNMESQGIFLFNTRNVTVKNTKISGFSTGIKLSFSADNTVSDNSVTNCTYGILADRAPKTKITNNTIQSNKWDGIFITASPNSQITNNKVENNGKWGIYLGYSSDCTLKNNQMNSNRYNFGVSVNFIQDIDTSNTINSQPIIYWINQQNRQVPLDAGYVAIINSNNIEARNLHLAENGQGITLVNSVNIHIENCNITGNSYYGISLINSNYNTVTNNTITRNEGAGIAIISSASNTLTNNTIESNYTGINLQTSNENYIHHNNFINNTRQVANKDSINTWDDSYPSGGNYWSDYKGKDHDNDGIGDTTYTIDNDNQDKYPLMTIVKKMPGINHNTIEPITPFAIVIITVVASALALHILKKRRTHSTETLHNTP